MPESTDPLREAAGVDQSDLLGSEIFCINLYDNWGYAFVLRTDLGARSHRYDDESVGAWKAVRNMFSSKETYSTDIPKENIMVH